MSYKSIEIYYDISEIPGITDRSGFSAEALNFRNEAIEQIESAIIEAGVGEWSGAEIGSGEVNFGFAVEDFDAAEAVVRAAIKDTKFDCIREITRFEMSEEEMAAQEDKAAIASQVPPMRFWEVIVLLVFRRMPKRFRDR